MSSAMLSSIRSLVRYFDHFRVLCEVYLVLCVLVLVLLHFCTDILFAWAAVMLLMLSKASPLHLVAASLVSYLPVH